jgi:hypothetical protein
MAKCVLALITVGLLVSGCASAPPPPPFSGGRFAWDGLGQNPNKPVRHKRRPTMVLASNKADKPDPNAEREKVLGTLRAYSAAWWAVQDEIEAEEQKRINAKIVICRACLPTASPEEHTASVRR